MKKALKRAIKKLGGPTAAGAALKASKQSVSQWVKCPPQHVLNVERLTGVSKHELRPDIFGVEP